VRRCLSRVAPRTDHRRGASRWVHTQSPIAAGPIIGIPRVTGSPNLRRPRRDVMRYRGLRGSATVSCGNLQRRRSGTLATSGRNARAGQGHRRPTHRHGANGRRRCAELRGRGVVVPGSPDDAAGRRDTSSRSRRWCRCSAAPSGTLSRGAMPAWLERDSRANRTQHGQLHARLPRRVRGGRVESTTDCGHLCGTRRCLQGITPLPATPG
jgi:hypothetical protein